MLYNYQLLLHHAHQLTAYDVDTGSGGRVHYSCGSGCSEGALSVSHQEGEILVASPLDADKQEDGTRHVVTVVATDGGGLAATASVTVTGWYKCLLLELKSRNTRVCCNIY